VYKPPFNVGFGGGIYSILLIAQIISYQCNAFKDEREQYILLLNNHHKSMANPQSIRLIVEEIRASKLQDDAKLLYFASKYEDFSLLCPKLFEAALDTSFPLTYLEMMMQQIALLDKKRTDKDAANQVVFKVLNDQYVEPLVNAPKS
jgi:Tfp pilus assembly protein PilN